ncbi:MAG: DUF2934 domain-containing protein [Myxococcales bacterium]|nr:DUF2934 domain-containing protein [Myxococcales bacterium]
MDAPLLDDVAAAALALVTPAATARVLDVEAGLGALTLLLARHAAHVGGMLGGGGMALVVAPGGLIGRSTAARALVVVIALAFVTTTAPKVSRARKSDAPTTTDSAQSMRDLIAQRAYERFIARGYEHGHDVEDWLGAERELTQQQ